MKIKPILWGAILTAILLISVAVMPSRGAARHVQSPLISDAICTGCSAI
jgi:hypothetical protein